MSLNLSGKSVAGITLNLGNAALAVGTTGATFDTGNAISFAIAGQVYSKAIVTSGAMTAQDSQAVSTSCLYLFSLDSAGAVTVKKGTEVLTTAIAPHNPLFWPEPEAGKCVFAGVRIDCDASTTFTSGTTLMDATGLTDTYYNFASLPVQPLVA